MLGRLSMTVDECIQAYENLADRVFGHPRHFHIRKVSTLWRLSLPLSPLKRVKVRLENAGKGLILNPRHGNADANFRLSHLGYPGINTTTSF